MSYCGYDCVTGETGCGPGWDALIFPLIERCKAEGIQILQIKEKYGELRFYIGPAPDDLLDAIDEAEMKSAETCELCGRPGRIRGTGWLSTRCDAHYEEARK